jgi:SNF2 family DNA or RNA helicase
LLTNEDIPYTDVGEPRLTQTQRTGSLSRVQCLELLDLLDEIEIDSKWEACRRLLVDLRVGEERPVVIFTEYTDTATYLGIASENEGWPTFSSTSNNTFEHRKSAIKSARESNGTFILTTAASAGLDVSITDTAVHYDLPWNPKHLLQRYTRLERFGSPFESVQHYHLAAVNSLEDGILNRLKGKQQDILFALLGDEDDTVLGGLPP